MKIALIRPAMFGTPAVDTMMPLVFAVIRGLTPPSIELSFHDERAEALPDSIAADVVALSVETFAARRAYQLADQYRMAGKTVLMGGFHPTLLPDECLEHADAVLIGDAETTWPQALKDLAQGQLQSRYNSVAGTDPAAIRLDYSVFKHWRYRSIGLVEFGRGCRYDCDFCSIHAFYGSRIISRPLDTVVEEIRRLKQKLLFFVDDNLFADEKRAIELFQALIPLRKHWACQVSMDIARKPELLRLMRQSGCIMVLIGFESLDPVTLKTIGKTANLGCGDYQVVIQAIHEAGLMIYGTFVVGYDQDTSATARQLMDFAIQNGFACANFNPLMPMPGTRLYQRLEREGRLIFSQWWLDDRYHYGDAQFIPEGMTETELMQSCREARFRFHSIGSWVQRLQSNPVLRQSWRHLLIFLLTGLVSQREIHFKQGRPLGKASSKAGSRSKEVRA